METASIVAIKNLLLQVQENLDTYQQYHKDNNTDMDACSYGSEQEYCIKSLIAGIKNILTDLGYLTRAHNLFLKLSTYANRNDIKSHLSNINTYLKNRNTANIVSAVPLMYPIIQYATKATPAMHINDTFKDFFFIKLLTNANTATTSIIIYCTIVTASPAQNEPCSGS